MIYLLLGIIVILVVVVALKIQRACMLKEEIHWIKQIVASDGCVSDNEKEKIVEFGTCKNLSSDRIDRMIREIEEDASQIKPQVEVINWNRKNGIEFEKKIAAIAARDHSNFRYTLLSWTGDKYSEGHYAKSNCDPDLRVQVELSRVKREFAVECKWRKSFNEQGYVEIAKPYQIKHYRKRQREWRCPVFIALGIGGCGKEPDTVYLVPLDEVKGCKLWENQVQKYKRAKNSEPLYFDVKKGMLS